MACPKKYEELIKGLQLVIEFPIILLRNLKVAESSKLTVLFNVFVSLTFCSHFYSAAGYGLIALPLNFVTAYCFKVFVKHQ
jgi:hypothetical protein